MAKSPAPPPSRGILSESLPSPQPAPRDPFADFSGDYAEIDRAIAAAGRAEQIALDMLMRPQRPSATYLRWKKVGIFIGRVLQVVFGVLIALLIWHWLA